MKVIDYLAEELKLEEMGGTKEAIASLGKFYPKTLRAFGGAKGLKKWLTRPPSVGMTTRVARVFRAENNRISKRLGAMAFAVRDSFYFYKNDRIHTEAKEFNKLYDATELMSVVCGALPSIARR